VLAEDIGPKWLYWPWVTDHLDEIQDRLTEHIELTLYAVGIGLLVAILLAIVCMRYRRTYGPTIAFTGVLYTVPALALFALLAPITGLLSRWTAIIPLALYTLLILVRNIVAGFDGVAPEVKEAARGMGYSRRRQLLRVELPLALPTIFVGVRVAVATTIGLVTVTALIGQGGLGSMMLDGFNRAFRTPLTVGIVLSLTLAIVADLILLAVQWAVTPWQRAGKRSARRTARRRERLAPTVPTDLAAPDVVAGPVR
jgi:osmoprotectant transport system permease protein